MNCIVSLQNCHVEALAPNVNVFGDRAFTEILKMGL